MEHGVGRSNGGANRIGVEEVEIEAAGGIDLMPRLLEQWDGVAADHAGAAGDEDPHSGRSYPPM